MYFYATQYQLLPMMKEECEQTLKHLFLSFQRFKEELNKKAAVLAKGAKTPDILQVSFLLLVLKKRVFWYL